MLKFTFWIQCPNFLLDIPVATDFKCPQKHGVFEDAVQCDKYYECEEGVATTKLCPDGLVFDPLNRKVNKCDQPFNVDCGDRLELRKYHSDFNTVSYMPNTVTLKIIFLYGLCGNLNNLSCGLDCLCTLCLLCSCLDSLSSAIDFDVCAVCWASRKFRTPSKGSVCISRQWIWQSRLPFDHGANGLLIVIRNTWS